MEAYRDQYATLFNNGRKVVVLTLSNDPDTTLRNWAREASFPGLFGADTGQVVGKLYGSASARADLRHIFVLGPDGKISDRIIAFNVLSADAYEQLHKMVDSASKK